jgi:nitrite reductase/ring-hydroxylating ferredoxin subunit
MVKQKFMQTNWKVFCPLHTSVFYVQRGAAFIHHFDLCNIRAARRVRGH